MQDALAQRPPTTGLPPGEDPATNPRCREDRSDETFDLNVKGYYFCAQAALAGLERSGRGSNVNITSIHGDAGFPNHDAYAGTKAAVIGFTPH